MRPMHPPSMTEASARAMYAKSFTFFMSMSIFLDLLARVLLYILNVSYHNL